MVAMVPIRLPLHAFTGKTLDQKKINTEFIAIELSASASVWSVCFFNELSWMS